MPVGNNFQHSAYDRKDPGERVAYREVPAGAPPGSPAWLDAMAGHGKQLAGAGVRALCIPPRSPTPLCAFAVAELGAAGGVVVTASHNPAEWNALKLVSGEGIFLDADASGAFRSYLAEVDPPRATWDALGSVRMRTKSSLVRSCSSTRIGKRPCNSGIRSLGLAR